VTVKELIEQLQKFPPDANVFVTVPETETHYSDVRDPLPCVGANWDDGTCADVHL
jgi:hypothetical protein